MEKLDLVSASRWPGRSLTDSKVSPGSEKFFPMGPLPLAFACAVAAYEMVNRI